MSARALVRWARMILLVGAILVSAVGAFAQLPANVMLVRGTIDGAEPGR